MYLLVIVPYPVLLPPQIMLDKLPWVGIWPAGMTAILSPQTCLNLVLLAPVAFATLESPGQSRKKPRQATSVRARALGRTLIRLPVLTVRRRLLS